MLLGPERFEEYVSEMMAALETGSDPGHSGRSGSMSWLSGPRQGPTIRLVIVQVGR